MDNDQFEIKDNLIKIKESLSNKLKEFDTESYIYSELMYLISETNELEERIDYFFDKMYKSEG